MRRFLGALSLCVSLHALVGPVLADGLDDGRRAYRTGDYPAAMAMLRPLAQYGGDPQAQYLVGMMCANGQGAPRDARAAAQWYELAARQGLPDAAFALGFLYYYGAGDEGTPTEVVADPATAAVWFTQAATRGNATAQYLLGHMYRTGQGIPADPAAARRWLLEAAEQGVVGAQYEAGLLFAYQPGFQNGMAAYKWFELAARASYPGAAQNRELVADRLNDTERQQASELADAWHPQGSASAWPTR
jgi:TPR repeat protein